MDASIDFEKIASEIQKDIDSANQSMLKEHPKAAIGRIDESARIAKGVCISALRAYHEELCRVLQGSSGTNP